MSCRQLLPLGVHPEIRWLVDHYVDELCRYRAVISLGRLHAALCAKANSIPHVYAGNIPIEGDRPSGRLTLEEFSAYATHFRGKLGIIDQVGPATTLDDYVNAFRTIL